MSAYPGDSPNQPVSSDVDLGVVLLTDDDFPPDFINGHHPEDFEILEYAFEPKFIHHEKDFHNRLFVRLCIRGSQNEYYGILVSFCITFSLSGITFLCDTTAPEWMYLSKQYVASSLRILGAYM
jgi:hypothetical protein